MQVDLIDILHTDGKCTFQSAVYEDFSLQLYLPPEGFEEAEYPLSGK